MDMFTPPPPQSGQSAGITTTEVPSHSVAATTAVKLWKGRQKRFRSVLTEGLMPVHTVEGV